MQDKLPRGLYAIADDSAPFPGGPAALAAAAFSGGAGVVQLRLKGTGARQALDLIRSAVAAAKASGGVVIVNDRVDLALAGGAHGVHLGAEDLPVAAARAVLGPRALIGATVRNGSDIVAAQRDGADHVGLGPLFVTGTKSVDAPLLGLEAFGRLVAASPLPVVGIAGITLETIGAVAAAGAHGAAVVSDLLRGDAGPVSRVRALQAAFWGAR